MPSAHADSKAKSIVFAFTPRQVLLGRQTMKQSNDDEACSNRAVNLKAEKKALLHQSIAHYLQRSGFKKALKKFRSEAQIEKDNVDASSVDLEEMCFKYLEGCKDAKAAVSDQKEQGKHSQKDGEGNLIPDTENASKKKKNNRNDNDAIVHQSGTDSKNSGEMANESSPDSKGISKEKDADDKCKEKKKKKCKLASESVANNVEDNQLKSPPQVTEVKLKNSVSENAETGTVETKKRSKDKKKKKVKSGCDSVGDPNTTVSKKVSSKKSNEELTEKEKKVSKKRKRLTSEENDVQLADPKADEEFIDTKIENLDEENIGKSDQLQKKSSEQLNGKTNGDLQNTEERSSTERSLKKQRYGSVEQKTVKTFQRVKLDDVVYADERLQDNSYWAKDGAENGYGAKAQEVLGQVRGRDFRHEKTKKKRGSYRGGQIDFHSHSIKFNYSDDE